MSKPTSKSDLFWGYLAQALNIGAGLILLPVILYYLTPADVGLWFVFITIASLTQLLEFGFQPTISRNVSYVCSGATSINKIGLPQRTEDGKVDLELLEAITNAAKKIYRAISCVAALVMIVGGTLYVWTLLTPDQTITTSLAAWICFAAGYVVTFYYGYINAVLIGRGDTAANNKVVIISRLSMITIGSAMIIAGFGLVGMGVASLCAAIVSRLAAYKYVLADSRFNFVSRKYEESGNYDASITKNLWHNARKLGVTQVGAFLIQRGNILIGSSFLGLEVAAKYSITVTILLTLSSVAAVICNVQVPYISHLQVARNKAEIIPLFGEMLFVSWTVYIVGFLILYLQGPALLALIGSKTQLLPSELLILIGIVLLLELTHSISAIYLTTTNHVPFVPAALISGTAILLLSLFLVQPFHLLGIILAQGVVQAAYNNWKWPVEALKDLDTHIGTVVKAGAEAAFRRIGLLRPKHPSR